MALGFWNYKTEDIQKIINDEGSIMKLVKSANMIDDYHAAPLFLYLYYRHKDKQSISLGLINISEERQTDMMPHDNFFGLFKRLRKRGHSNIDFSTLSYSHLCKD